MKDLLNHDDPYEKRRMKYRNSLKLTTNHSASSYGIPVLVGNDGIAYGVGDDVAFEGKIFNSAKNLASALYKEGKVNQELYVKFMESEGK